MGFCSTVKEVTSLMQRPSSVVAWPPGRVSASKRVAPATLHSAEASFEALGIRHDTLAFTPADGGGSARISMDVSSLMRLLTTPASQEERVEWARHLVLEAQQHLPDAHLRHLWTSVGREGWHAHRLRFAAVQQLRGSKRATSAGNAPNSPLSLRTVVSQARGAREAEEREARATEERELLASELNWLSCRLRGALARQRAQDTNDRQPDKLSPLAQEESVEETGFVPDILRAGRAHITSTDAHDGAVASGGAAGGTHGGVGGGVGGGSVTASWGSSASSASPAASWGSTGTTPAVLYCQPTWVEVLNGSRWQATLHFVPGISQGDEVRDDPLMIRR